MHTLHHQAPVHALRQQHGHFNQKSSQTPQNNAQQRHHQQNNKATNSGQQSSSSGGEGDYKLVPHEVCKVYFFHTTRSFRILVNFIKYLLQ